MPGTGPSPQAVTCGDGLKRFTAGAARAAGTQAARATPPSMPHPF